MASREYHVQYGRHSLIPECCITFFVDRWYSELWRDSAYKDTVHGSDYDYVPCPKCFYSNNKVKLRVCERDCGRECREDYAHLL